MTADWQVFPTTAWNYAIAISPEDAADSVSIREAPLCQRPFTAQPAPVELRVKARKLPSWRAGDGAANPVPTAPVSSDQPEESIALVPYAAANFALLLFPNSNPGDRNTFLARLNEAQVPCCQPGNVILRLNTLCLMAICINLCAMPPAVKSSWPRVPESATQLIRIFPASRRPLQLQWDCTDSCRKVDSLRIDRQQRSTATQ